MSIEQSPARRLLRTKEVCEIIGKSRWQLRRDVIAGKFPQPVMTGPNSPRWWEHEVFERLASLPRQTYGGLVEHEG